MLTNQSECEFELFKEFLYFLNVSLIFNKNKDHKKELVNVFIVKIERAFRNAKLTVITEINQ